MHAEVVLLKDPIRPVINPKYDLFAWLDLELTRNIVFPANVFDRVPVMLPEKCRNIAELTDDLWDFLNWQCEERGYFVVRNIDAQWFYWSMIAEKYTLLDMVSKLV